MKAALVMLDVDSSRYRMLDTVRTYAAEKLGDGNEEAATRSRHLEWCLGLAERARPVYGKSVASGGNSQAALRCRGTGDEREQHREHEPEPPNRAPGPDIDHDRHRCSSGSPSCRLYASRAPRVSGGPRSRGRWRVLTRRRESSA